MLKDIIKNIKESKSPKDFSQQLTELKKLMRECGFTAWEWAEPYSELEISFKDNKTALKCFKKHKDLINYISKTASVENGKISLETYDE